MKVSEICEYAPKSNIKAGDACDGGKYVFFTSSADESKRYNDYQNEGEGIIMGTGGNATLHYYDGKYAVSTDCVVLLPNEQIRCKYLYYFFLGNMRILEEGFKGAGLKHTNKGYIGGIDIGDIPPFEKQDKIIEMFDSLRSIIDLRTNEIEKLDELIKARFVELFGDARENPKGFDMVPFIDIVEYMGDIGSNGANKVVVDHLDMKDEEDYALMVRFTNFTKNDFSEDVKFISKEAYDFFEKSQIFGGELIICKIGSAGQNYVMPYLNRPVSLGLNQIMVRVTDNVLMPYLYQYLHTDYGEFLISGCINGAVTKTITKTELKKIPVMMPPMELQQQFADFVKQVDKSKVAVQKALDETQLLFDSLMQEYFG